MSWWDPSGLSTFATQALKTAQKRIDKVLDIEVEEGDDEGKPSTRLETEPSPAGGASESTPSSEAPPSGTEQDGFWNAWLSPTATSSTPELSTSLSGHAGKKKETRDRSQLKGKLGLRKKLRTSLSVQIPSPPKVESEGAELETSEAGPLARVAEDVNAKLVEETKDESKPDDVENSSKEEGVAQRKVDDFGTGEDEVSQQKKEEVGSSRDELSQDVLSQRKKDDVRIGEEEVSQWKKDDIGSCEDEFSQRKKDDIRTGEEEEVSQWKKDDIRSGKDEVSQQQKHDGSEDESSQLKTDDRSGSDAESSQLKAGDTSSGDAELSQRKRDDRSRDEDESSQQKIYDGSSCEVESSQTETEGRSSSDIKYDADLNPAVAQAMERSTIGVHGTGEEHSGELQAGQTTSLEGGEVFVGVDDVIPPRTSLGSEREELQTEDNENNRFATLPTTEGRPEQTMESSMQHSSDASNDGEMVPREDAIALSMSSGWSEASLVTLTDQQVTEDYDACKELDTEPVVDRQTVVASSQESPVEHFDEEIGRDAEVEVPHGESTTDVELEETSRMKVSVAPVHCTPIVDEAVSPDLTVTAWKTQSDANASYESATAVIDDGISRDELSESNRTLTSGDCAGSGVVSPEDAASVDVEGKDGEKGEAAETSTGENLSSSCYVKDLLEEAMVESAKDSDSKASSTSSCRASHTESTQNSGQTSADEIDTTTSSDIEIISHISTPTPNDDLAPFNLSPLRHALSRGFPRGTGQGHARSDSSSSGASKNGDELSPEGRREHQGRGVRTGSESTDAVAEESLVAESECQIVTSNSEEMEKLLKAIEPTLPLQPIPETADPADNEVCEGRLKPPVDLDPNDPSFLLERLASMAEVLDVRERKLVELSKENMDLQETTGVLRSQLQQSEEAREAEMADVNQLSDEFTERLSDSESRLQKVIREKDVFKKKLHEAETEFAKGRSSEKLLREKDQQIGELLMEGEKLSKQQLTTSNVIKKLRSKDKENDSLIKTFRQKTEDQKTEVDHLHEVLDSKIELEKKQTDAIKLLNDAVVKQELEISSLKEEVDDSNEKMRSMQVTLDHSYKELAELQKMDVARQSRTHEEVLSAEMQAKEEMRLALERSNLETRQRQDSLIIQIDDLRLTLTRQEREHARREDMLKQEIADLQQRLSEADDRNQELTQSVSAATRPLLRQIENLHTAHTAQVASYERVERNLTDRLNEAQVQLAAATEKERAATEQTMDVASRSATLDSQVASLRQEKCRLNAALEMEQTKADLLHETKINETTRLEMTQQTLSKDNRELKKENILLENQLEVEKMRAESEKKKVILAHEMLRDKEMQLSRITSQSPASRRGSIHSESSISQDEVLERTLMAAVGANGNKMSLYDSLRQSGASTLLENLQSQLKQRNGEIAQLQSEITELERTRESMAKELVNLTTKNDEMEEKVDSFTTLQQQYKAQDKRYNALLQMYGEKVEQSQELSLDLQEMKEMYKSQINELMTRTEQ